VAGTRTSDGAGTPQAADRSPPPGWRERAGWAAAWTATVALALWTRHTSAGWLALAAAGALLWTLLGARRAGRLGLGAAAVLWLAAGTAAGVQARLDRVTSDWELVRILVEEEAGDALGEDLNAIVDRGETATDGAVSAARAAASREDLFERLRQLQRGTGVSAVVVYGADGAPVAWSGEHRGTVPDSVRRGIRPYFFSAGPVFGYLYFSRGFGDGRTAVAAILLEANVSAGEGTRPFSDVFAGRHGITPRFTPPELAQGESVWDWSSDGPILSVAFVRLTQERWRERIVARGRWGTAAGWGLALALLAAAWYRRRRGSPGALVSAATLALFVAPLGEMTGTEEVFSPLGFVLPLPVDVTLGALMVLLTGGSVWLLTHARPLRSRARLRIGVRVAAVALVLPLALLLVLDSASQSLLAAHSAGGISLVMAATLAAAIPVFLLFPAPSGEPGDDTGARWWVPAVVLSVALGVATVLWWRPGREIPVWTPALWAVPFGLFAVAFARSRPGRGSLLPWLAAGWIGATIAASGLWVAHLEARLGSAEAELARLGTVPDPYLDFLLRSFAERALMNAGEGREGVGLLYQSWVGAGLAREGYEGHVTLWAGGTPAAELRLTDVALPDSLVAPLLARAAYAEEPVVERYTDQPAVHYLLMVPLPGGRAVTVAVPPRSHLGRSGALARFLDPGREPDEEGGPTALTLVPVEGTEAAGAVGEPGGMQWIHTAEGWRSETVVSFPGGPMHGHLLVRTPSPFLLGVRAALVLAFALGVMAVLWTGARTLCGELLGMGAPEWVWTRTFRGRLTLALFAFFLLPMAAFGATTYQALSREVVRTAAALAERALDQAAAEVPGQPLAALAERVRADLLLYDRGVLSSASSPEVLELGLYNTWLPPSFFLFFDTGEAVRDVEERELAGREYLVAYRRVSPTQVLAAPTALASGEIARRQRELGNAVLLAVLLGAGLSLVLSFFVGRALSRPIDDLSRAAAAVGGGNLGIRLRETREDEFGGLYRSFNRMVHRLRRTRAALERETRRTEAVVAEAGTGVLALDAAGRVALINARAAEILGAAVEAGGPVPEDTPVAAELARAVRDFRGSGALEHGEEVEIDGRVIRLRLRRLRGETEMGGAVVVLEDVTTEMRSARVLAWGEMARQVAHEIKNPLTPIKLSVQHLRRAHADGRPDFEQILNRNVEAILGEIDRLGEIARAFARFGAPAQAAGGLEAVSLGRVAEETLALYRGTDDGIAYRVEAAADTPEAFARVGELKEVLVNLLENARAALPDGGEIRITAAPAGGGAWAMLNVEDSGEGIPAELLPRVFEPQFSTRSSGTGLGLAIVRRLVESWGGEVTVDSEPGRGTTVHLRLRAATGEESAAG
jgi:two-component system nitrogen regulation sensor histidine kinase NtrY